MSAREEQVERFLGARQRQLEAALGGVFVVGERVRVREGQPSISWPAGTVCVVSGLITGRWLHVARFDRDDELWGVGSSFFEIDGPCGLHAVGGWDSPERVPGEWGEAPSQTGWAVCGRCDMPMPEHLSGYHMHRRGARLVPRWRLRW